MTREHDEIGLCAKRSLGTPARPPVHPSAGPPARPPDRPRVRPDARISKTMNRNIKFFDILIAIDAFSNIQNTSIAIKNNIERNIKAVLIQILIFH